MVNPDYVPDRGDLIWLEFNPQTGREQAGRRPALVLSPRIYNEPTNLAILCPITSRIKGNPFECVIPDGLPIAGAVLCDHVKSLDWRARLATFACAAPERFVETVRAKIATLI